VWTNKTLADYVLEAAQASPDAVLMVADGRGVTVSDFVQEATILAQGLYSMGFKSGETISFQLPNWKEAAVIDLACVFGGFIVNPIVPIYRHAELGFILNDARAKAVFIPQVYRGVDYAQILEDLRPKLPMLQRVFITRGGGDDESTYHAVMQAGRSSGIVLAGSEPESVKQVIYTSGTTGPAKGVLYTHNQARRTLANSFDVWGLAPGVKVLIGTPVTHVSGFSYGPDLMFYLGAQCVLMEKWDADEAVELIDRHQVDVMVGATPFLADLIAGAERAKSRLASLKIFFCGGAAVPPGLVRRAYEVFENCRTFRCFGSTECPLITHGCPEDIELAATTDGRIHGYEVKVVGDDGTILPPDVNGEILARGPAMFCGYTDPGATREAFDDEGFFRTGDIGKVTKDGVLTVTGRKKDLIIRGGENLSPKEIEDALHTHPDLKEAAVVSIPHARLGEGVGVFLIAKGQHRPDRSELAAHLKGRGLAPQKWPERVEYLADFPRTPSGKVQKHLLRKDIAEKMEKEAR
jgi:acyl-CoA synthetase (AMP-forming)/AMP-acid ligase II